MNRRPLPPPPGKTTELPPEPPTRVFPGRPLPLDPEPEQPIYDEGEEAPVSRGNARPLPPHPTDDQSIYDQGDEAPVVPRMTRPAPLNPPDDQASYDLGEEAPSPVPRIPRPLPPKPADQNIYDESEAGPPVIPQGRKPLPPSPGLIKQNFGPDETYDEFDIAPSGGPVQERFDKEEYTPIEEDEENPYELEGFHEEKHTICTPDRALPVTQSPVTWAPVTNRPPANLPPTPQEIYSDPREETSPPAPPHHMTAINQLPASQPPRRNISLPPPPVKKTSYVPENYEEVPDFLFQEVKEGVTATPGHHKLGADGQALNYDMDGDFYEATDDEPTRFAPLPERPARPLPKIESAQDANSGSSDSSGGHMPMQPKVNKKGPAKLGGVDISQIRNVKLKPTNLEPKISKTSETPEYNHILSAKGRLRKAANEDIVPLKPPNSALNKSAGISPPPPTFMLKEVLKSPLMPKQADNSARVPRVKVSPPVHVEPTFPPKSYVKPHDIPPAIVSTMTHNNNNNNNGEPDQLEVYPWFHGSITREETQARLSKVVGDGVFLVRNSKKGKEDQPYTLTILYQNNFFTLKIRCREKDKKIALGEEKTGEMCFTSVASLIAYHKEHNVILIGNPGGKTQLLSFPERE